MEKYIVIDEHQEIEVVKMKPQEAEENGQLCRYSYDIAGKHETEDVDTDTYRYLDSLEEVLQRIQEGYEPTYPYALKHTDEAEAILSQQAVLEIPRLLLDKLEEFKDWKRVDENFELKTEFARENGELSVYIEGEFDVFVKQTASTPKSLYIEVRRINNPSEVYRFDHARNVSAFANFVIMYVYSRGLTFK